MGLKVGSHVTVLLINDAFAKVKTAKGITHFVGMTDWNSKFEITVEGRYGMEETYTYDDDERGYAMEDKEALRKRLVDPWEALTDTWARNRQVIDHKACSLLPISRQIVTGVHVSDSESEVRQLRRQANVMIDEEKIESIDSSDSCAGSDEGLRELD